MEALVKIEWTGGQGKCSERWTWYLGIQHYLGLSKRRFNTGSILQPTAGLKDWMVLFRLSTAWEIPQPIPLQNKLKWSVKWIHFTVYKLHLNWKILCVWALICAPVYQPICLSSCPSIPRVLRSRGIVCSAGTKAESVVCKANTLASILPLWHNQKVP